MVTANSMQDRGFRDKTVPRERAESQTQRAEARAWLGTKCA